MEESAVHLKYSGQGFAHNAIAFWALAKPIVVLPDHLHFYHVFANQLQLSDSTYELVSFIISLS